MRMASEFTPPGPHAFAAWRTGGLLLDKLGADQELYT